MKTLRTKRLIIRDFKMKDANEYFKVVSDEETMRHIDWGPLNTINDAADYIASVIDSYKRGHLEWVVETKQNRIIGSIVVYDSNESDKQIAYIFLKEIWGQKYAKEAVKAVSDYLLSSGIAQVLHAKHARTNPASGGVLKGCGFVFEKIVNNAFRTKGGERIDCLQYIRTK